VRQGRYNTSSTAGTVGLIACIVLAGCKKEQTVSRTATCVSTTALSKSALPAKSIHVGLSRVNQDRYGGSDQSCDTCLDDVEWYYETARANGYDAKPPFKDEGALAGDILAAIRGAADELESTGGTLLITFSGHGALAPPENPVAQAWCVYNRQLLDWELLAILVDVSPKIRVVFISDSCYAGGMLNRGAAKRWIEARDVMPEGWPGDVKALPLSVQRKIWEEDGAFYTSLIHQAEREIGEKQVKASVTLLAAAGADGIARMSGGNGKSTFTASIADTFELGKKLQCLFDDAKAETMRRVRDQIPVLDPIGNVPPEHFEKSVVPPE
jgi:hypothetical protein